MRRFTRRVAWILAAFALLFVLTSCMFPAVSCHHQCTGDDDCPVCMQIRMWQTVLRLFGTCLLCVWFALGVRNGLRAARHARTLFVCRRSPVALKTRLLN